jgi:hypothetical protein
MNLHEQARAEAEKRYPYRTHETEVMRWVTRKTRVTYVDGFLAGHEAATRTRVVTTVSELDALPVGSVVRSLGGGAAWQKMPVSGFWVGVIGTLDPRGLGERGYLPARVLYSPEETP